ncbi:MAG: T9SS type A sorting domain-containing protein, partial [Bacteroidia bacterium]
GVAFTPTATATYTVAGSNANGCIGTHTVEVVVNSCSTGINSIQNNSQISVYPNPNNGNFSVRMNDPEHASIEIFNTLGAKVYERSTISNLENINLEAGIYSVRVKQNGQFVYRTNIVVSK